MRDGSTAAESWVTAQSGDYSGMTFDGLTEEGYRDGSDVILDVANVDATGYCLIVTSHSLPTSDEWKIATYDSDESAPSPDDDCVTGRHPPVAARVIP